MISRLIIAALTTISLTSAAQAEVIYKCDITDIAPSGWVSNVMLFSVDEDNQTAMAYDYYINEVYGEAIPVKLSNVSSNLLKLKWEVRGLKTSNGRRDAGRVAYRANINKSTGKIRVNVTLVSFDNSSGGNGTCVRK